MAKPEFDTPALEDWLSTPAVQPDAMAHSRPFVAKPEHQSPLGFPGELVENWQDVALSKMDELLGRYRSLQVFMDACGKCGGSLWLLRECKGRAEPEERLAPAGSRRARAPTEAAEPRERGFETSAVSGLN